MLSLLIKRKPSLKCLKLSIVSICLKQQICYWGSCWFLKHPFLQISWWWQIGLAAKIWKIHLSPLKRLEQAVIIFVHCREGCACVCVWWWCMHICELLCACHCIFPLLKVYEVSKQQHTHRHTPKQAAVLGQEKCPSTYSLSHKSSVLWLCIDGIWLLFLPCDCTPRDKRPACMHIASLITIFHKDLGQLPTHQDNLATVWKSGLIISA